VSFDAVTLCVASQRVFIVVSIYFIMTQSGNFWIHPRTTFMLTSTLKMEVVDSSETLINTSNITRRIKPDQYLTFTVVKTSNFTMLSHIHRLYL
jgi:hypothetical protein